MKSYLVDFENVKSKGLVGIDRLDENDHVVIFYSENSDTISFDMHCSVMRAKASVEYLKVKVGGKNALDFQLSTLLGYMVAQEKNSHIFIISNDKGFDKLHDFWTNTFEDAPDCIVFRTQNIASAINYAKNNVSKAKNVVLETSEELADNTEYGEDEIAVPANAKSKTAEIIVTETLSEESADETDSADIADSDDVTNVTAVTNVTEKFIVPEPMVEQFRNESAAKKPKRKTKTKSAAEKKNDAAEKVKQAEKADIAENKNLLNFAEGDDLKIYKHVENTMQPYPPTRFTKEDMENFHDPYRELEEREYEPILERFLRSAESKDKHGIVKKCLPELPDETIDPIIEMVLESDCKLSLHNMLVKRFGNEVSTVYYNKLKPYYGFFKRVLPENQYTADTADTADTVGTGENTDNESGKSFFAENFIQMVIDANKDNPLVKRTPENEEIMKRPVDERFAAEASKNAETVENTADSDTDGGDVKTESPATKVGAAAKKKLHQTLDGIATADEFSGIVAQINQSSTMQKLYINMMKRFGKERGSELYRVVRKDYQLILKEQKDKQNDGTAKAEKTAKSTKSTKSTKSAKAEKSQETKVKTPVTDTEKAAEETVKAVKAVQTVETVQAKPKKVDTAMKKTLHTLLDEKITADEFSGTVDVINHSENSHSFYIGMVKRFKQKRGLYIYNMVKSAFADFISKE